MGRTRGAYEAEFPVGSTVQIVGAEELNEFARTWRYHHPLTPEQLEFAGRTAVVENVAFYHGGDEIYKLRGLCRHWHEQCLIAPAKF
jgi:hypothetical protein